MKITEEILRSVKSFGLTIEEYYLIYAKAGHPDWINVYQPSNSSYQRLRDKGIMTKSGDLTIYGLMIYGKILVADLSPTELEFHKEWEEFWETFPSNDGFDNYEKSRNLRGRKQGCKSLYKRYLMEGVKHSKVVENLKREIEARKRASKKESNLKYMKNSYRWLRDKEWEEWDKPITVSNNKSDVI